MAIVILQSVQGEGEGLRFVTKISIKTKEINSLIGTLTEVPDLEWSKVWSIGAKTIGLFTYEYEQGEYGGAVNVIVEHDTESNEGLVWILQYGSPLSPIMQGARHLLETVGNAALSLKWHFEVLRPIYKGVVCPHCKAVYAYPESKREFDGSLVCQNCGKNFRPDIQLKEDVRIGYETSERVRCPFCSMSYVYRTQQINEDGSVTCQHCGMHFPLEHDEFERYSHRFYLGDDT